jgi:hypothetical protein
MWSMFTSAEHVDVARRLPGDLAMWFFILAELSVFALLILAFTVAQALHPQMFSEGRQLLDRSTGLAMTLGLLTAGLFAALALEQARQDRPRRAALLLGGALLLACGYVGIKLSEYAHLLANGLGMEHNTFFTLYWISPRSIFSMCCWAWSSSHGWPRAADAGATVRSNTAGWNPACCIGTWWIWSGCCCSRWSTSSIEWRCPCRRPVS